MKNKVCLILPYYGVFPNYFDLWLKSVSFNSKIADFYIVTDSEFPFDNIPPNVHVVNKSLNDIREKLHDVCGKDCCLSSPYKLCDYKPTYGEIFDDIVEGYEFWGWCDPDIIWGDLSMIINEETMDAYDVIGGGGPFTLQRNTDYFKGLYRHTDKTIDAFSFDETRSTKLNLIYDEWGYARMRKELNVKETNYYHWFLERALDVLPPNVCSPHRYMKIRFSEGLHFVEYANGRIYDVEILEDGSVHKKEYAYVHLQKRKMNRLCRNENNFLIYNELFLPASMYDEVIYNISKNYKWLLSQTSMIASGGVKLQTSCFMERKLFLSAC